MNLIVGTALFLSSTHQINVMIETGLPAALLMSFLLYLRLLRLARDGKQDLAEFITALVLLFIGSLSQWWTWRELPPLPFDIW